MCIRDRREREQHSRRYFTNIYKTNKLFVVTAQGNDYNGCHLSITATTSPNKHFTFMIHNVRTATKNTQLTREINGNVTSLVSAYRAGSELILL